MNLRFILIVLLGAVYGADHNVFKDCSRINFCSRLRGRSPQDNYEVNPQSISTNQNKLTATLRSKLGNVDLAVTLSALEEGTFRLQITETRANRYQLHDVLDGEPKPLNFDNVDTGNDGVTVTTGTGSNAAIIRYDPFNIEFSKDGTTEVVFNGDRLTMLEEAQIAPFTFGVTFPKAVQLYGLHEHCTSLALPSTGNVSLGSDPFRLKNSDVSYYEIDSPMALYGSVPVLYGHGQNATAGVFLHNAAEQWIDTSTDQAYWMVETGSLDLFVFLGPTPKDVVRQYTRLTGATPLPQQWTLGYHQSRFSYESIDDVLNVSERFDSSHFQLDAIWLDMDYTNTFKYLTWNPVTFPDPVRMEQAIASTNKKLVPIVDPHVKVEQGYWLYDGALARNLFVKNPDGTVYVGDCWPGASSFVDFLNPEARDFYASMFSFENFINSTTAIGGIWNDMNEPSVFDNSIEMTLPAESLHAGNVKHREVHNIYGLLHTMSTYNGLLLRDGGKKRPFILTRSHFAGSQRYAAIWTGDNQADWPYLHASFQQCLTANLLGIVFCGADVGGFYGDPSDELLQRWYQAGAWLPFFRSHSTSNVPRREPYLKPVLDQEIIREALQTRYRHLPIWYTLFYEHYKTGDPVIRPLFYHYPQDQNVYTIDDHLLLGRDILVRPVTQPGVSSVQVYFPGGPNELWISATNTAVHAGTGYAQVLVDYSSIPVYYRSGGLIIRKNRIQRNTVEMESDPHRLYFTLDSNNEAHGAIYLDDLMSFDYRDSSFFTYITIDIVGNQITFAQAEDSEGNFTFSIEFSVHREVVERPRNGRPGRYREIIHNTDSTGRFLKDIKINSRHKTVLKLN